MLSEIFWTFIVSTSAGLLLATVRMCYKSKCKTIDCCCIKIVRDVDVEEKEMEYRIDNLRQTSKDNDDVSIKV